MAKRVARAPRQPRAPESRPGTAAHALRSTEDAREWVRKQTSLDLWDRSTELGLRLVHDRAMRELNYRDHHIVRGAKRLLDAIPGIAHEITSAERAAGDIGREARGHFDALRGALEELRGHATWLSGLAAFEEWVPSAPPQESRILDRANIDAVLLYCGARLTLEPLPEVYAPIAVAFGPKPSPAVCAVMAVAIGVDEPTDGSSAAAIASTDRWRKLLLRRPDRSPPK